MTAPHLLTVAHGTRHRTGNEVAAALTRAAGERLGVEATTTYVELCDPLFVDVVAGLREPAVAVPLLLSSGFHVRTDLPEALDGAGAPVRLGPPFGPDRLLARTQVQRLEEAGAERGAPVVLLAAGSSDPLATDDQEAAAALLAQEWGAPARVATLSGLGRRPAEVVRPGDVVSPYLLSPGFFARRAAEESRQAGAVVVADVMGPHPLLVDLLVQRAEALAGA